jgi:hypothetical protein
LLGFAGRGRVLFEGVTAEELNFGDFFNALKSISVAEAEKAESAVEQMKKDATAVLVRTTWIGNVALFCVMFSFILLLVFALKNVAFL